ncbi:hypothetical protein GCM10010468_33830 [Actinocorallia longicatena]|uniref:MalT-like TPR region domain-containing protein n=1 Tax=Actinocorallia longicatena TaxID=111803 RepID=A0ABP6QA48_9ACTN
MKELFTEDPEAAAPEPLTGILTAAQLTGSWLLARGQYREAELELRQVLTARMRVLGADLPHTLTTRTPSPPVTRSLG